jgi:membrane-anchored glycerophosphoryl diester phosphodiesterase (GDPDase)
MATAPARELKIGAIIDKSFAVIERAVTPSLIFVLSLTVVDGVIAYFTANMSPVAQLAVTPLRVVIGVFFSYQLLKAMIERTGLRSRGEGDVFLTYFGLAVLYGLAVALGLILLVLPALFLMSRWCLAQPLVVARGDGVMQAFGESWQRTSGNEFPIIMVVLLFVMVPIVISVVAGVMLPKDNLVGIAIAQLATTISSLLGLAMGTALYGMIIGVPKAATTSAD